MIYSREWDRNRKMLGQSRISTNAINECYQRILSTNTINGCYQRILSTNAAMATTCFKSKTDLLVATSRVVCHPEGEFKTFQIGRGGLTNYQGGWWPRSWAMILAVGCSIFRMRIHLINVFFKYSIFISATWMSLHTDSGHIEYKHRFLRLKMFRYLKLTITSAVAVKYT